MKYAPRITSMLHYWSARTPGAPALECDGAPMTWRELHYLATTWAAKLVAAGIKPGDRLGFLTDNSNETIAFILAVLAADGVVVPLNVRLAANEIADVAVDAGLSAVLVDAPHIDQLAAARAALPGMRLYWRGAEAEGPHRLAADQPDLAEALDSSMPTDIGSWVPPTPEVTAPDRIAFLSYTSGTTGRPKAAMLTHANFFAAARAFAATDTTGRTDRSLLVLPLAFTGSLMATWAPIYVSGACLVLHRKFSAEATLAELAAGHVTIFYAVPVVFESIAALPQFATTELSAVRVMRAGGSPSSPETLRPYVERGLPLSVGWGQTESTGVGASLLYADLAGKPGTVGFAMPGIDIRIADPATGESCEPGSVGEVLLRGDSIMAGYWQAEELTESTINGDWLHTGDLGLLDTDGYLTLVGRSKDMLLSGGINVYPAEIERVISGVPGVKEVAVIGRTHERWGQVPVAFVVAESADVDAATLALVCKRELADYKRPKEFFIGADPLPRTMSGKIIKSQLVQPSAG